MVLFLFPLLVCFLFPQYLHKSALNWPLDEFFGWLGRDQTEYKLFLFAVSFFFFALTIMGIRYLFLSVIMIFQYSIFLNKRFEHFTMKYYCFFFSKYDFDKKFCCSCVHLFSPRPNFNLEHITNFTILEND